MVFVNLRQSAKGFAFVELNDVVNQIKLLGDNVRGYSDIQTAFNSPIRCFSSGSEPSDSPKEVMIGEHAPGRLLDSNEYALVTIMSTCTGVVTLNNDRVFVGHAWSGSVEPKDVPEWDKSNDFVCYIITRIARGEDFEEVVTGYGDRINEMIAKYRFNTKNVIVMSSSDIIDATSLWVYANSYVMW